MEVMGLKDRGRDMRKGGEGKEAMVMKDKEGG